MPVTVRCALCGAQSRQSVLSSTSTFGPPDLDLRPSGPARWALQFRVQCCPRCGYCAESIGQRTPRAGRTVGSVIYRDVLENARMPALARHFFCAATLNDNNLIVIDYFIKQRCQSRTCVGIACLNCQDCTSLLLYRYTVQYSLNHVYNCFCNRTVLRTWARPCTKLGHDRKTRKDT